MTVSHSKWYASLTLGSRLALNVPGTHKIPHELPFTEIANLILDNIASNLLQ